MSVTGYTKAGADAAFASKSAAWQASTAVKAGQLLTHSGTTYVVDADMTTPSSFNTTGLTAVGGGGSGLPISDPTGVTVDTTTYDNPVTGTGKITTLVFPSSPPDGDQVMLAVAVAGDAHPRQLWFANPTSGGVDFGDGTTDPWNQSSAGWSVQARGDGTYAFDLIGAASVKAGVASGFHDPSIRLDNGPLVLASATNFGFHGATVLTGTGAPVCAGHVGDMYIRDDGDDGSWIYRCTTEGAAGTAVWAAKL